MGLNWGKYRFHSALGGTATDGGLEQNMEELLKFCNHISIHDINTYLEIGIANGFLLRFMRDEMKYRTLGITLDERESHKGLSVLYGKSQDNYIMNLIGHADLIFVDGAHDYESVYWDYMNYKHKCNMMAFHDILGKRDCEGVKKLWNEIKNEHPSWEFISKDEEHNSGIGLIKIR